MDADVNEGPRRFWSAEEAKAAGWFSRRHPTRDAHDEATARYRESRGRGARRRRAAERAAGTEAP